MSILIKGMEMPKDFGRCVVIFPDGRVTTELGSLVIAKAVPVPPHGDLIERDGAVRDLRMDYAYAAARIVSLRPVIIPAEEAPAEDINVPRQPYDLLYEEGGASTT